MTQTVFSAARRPRRARLTRKALMMSCASAALAAAALSPQPSRAQAFQGSITGTTGSVVRATPSTTTETITVGSNTATINWSPTTQQQGGGAIDFLPSGNTATFTSAQGITDYTVLNRITPTSGQSIALNGHVISTLQGAGATGGNVWFYSPNGIVVGASAVFDVGGLLLTTNDVTSFGTSANGFNASFAGPAGSASAIQVENGAQINALQHNSYVALVAPRIKQSGKVRVNGSAAYVAGEQLSMTMNQGLFDIQVDVGTSDASGIVHSGETSGPANASASDNHGIYMVAVPKNQALTMLLSGGTVGFDATSASFENGQIILSSGASGGPASGMTISGGHYTSTVTATGTGAVEANGGGGTLTFDRDVNLNGLQSASLVAADGETVIVHGDAQVGSDDLRDFDTTDTNLGLDAQGGWAEVRADSGGALTIDGSATVTANALGATNSETLTGGTANGGFAMIDANGGTISIGGATQVSASGFADNVSHAGIDGRDSWGGDAEVSASGGGALHIGGNLDVIAEGYGSASALVSGGTGGTGHGQSATISADDNGSITVAGATNMSAAGVGGSLLTSADGIGGEGDGGDIEIDATSGGNISFGGSLVATASGYGQDALGQAGDGYGGTGALFIDGGSINAHGAFQIFADGFGGSGQIAGDGYGGGAFGGISGTEGLGSGGRLNVAQEFRLQSGGHGGVGAANAEGRGGDGGDGYGGTALFYISPDQDSEATVSVQLADAFITANGEGGAGGDGVTGGNGGSGYGYGDFDGETFALGEATAELFAGDVTVNQLQVFSTARGGSGGAGSAGQGGNGGDAYGGSSTLTIGGNLTGLALSYDRAFAGNGGAGTTQGDGGYAMGGYASIDVIEGGHLTGNIDITTDAFGGAGKTGGNADGGYSELLIEGDADAGTINVAAAGNGGAGLTGGDGSGGYAFIGWSDGAGTLNASGGTTLTAVGVGGDGFANASGIGGAGGTGTGGSVSLGSAAFDETPTVDAASPTLALGTVDFNANGRGGNGGAGATGGVGGDGQGGDVSMSIGGAMSAGTTRATVRGIGGDGGAASSGLGGNGGSAVGGTNMLWVTADGSLAGTTYTAYTNGFAGAGGAGGSARGDGGSAQSGSNAAIIDGTARFGGSADTHDGLIITSFAQAGSGNTGGSASAGTSSIDVSGSLNVAGQVQASAQALGGNGDSAGGTAEAGSASIGASGHLATGLMFIANNATGGNGTSIGGDAFGGSASLALDGGTAQIGSSATLEATATGGNASNGFGGYAQGGSVEVASTDGATLGGSSLTATTSATGGNGNRAGAANAGEIHLASDSWASGLATGMAFDNLTLSANGTVGVGGRDGETSGGGGSVRLTGSGASLTADTLSIQANGTNYGGTINIESDIDGDAGRLAFGSVDASANGSDGGGNVHVTSGSGSSIELGAAVLRASGGFGGYIALSAGSCPECGGGEDMAAAALPAGGGISADSLTMNTSGSISLGLGGGADISVAGTLSGSAGQIISLVDDGTGGAIRAHEIDLSAITIDDNADIIADIINFTSAGAMDLGTLSAADALSLNAGGDLTTGDLTAGNTLTLNSLGSIETGDLRAATVKLTASNDTSADDVQASGSASFIAGGLAQFTGVVSAPTINVTSGDIDIADGASLGVSGTTKQITLNANGHGQPVIIGDGPSAEGQYHLDEDGDIRSAALTINANGDVHVFDTQIEGSTTPGGGLGRVALNSEGSVLVAGVVDFINAGVNDSLAIKAGGRIEVNTDLGRIQMTDSRGALAGTLDLTGASIWIASQAVLTQLEADSNFVGRDAALAVNSGTANPDGFVRAGTIIAAVGDSFLVQNSGTPQLFAGVDTGDGGLAIESVRTTPATLIVYGRQTGTDGTVITNQDFLNSVDLTGTGGFTDDSAVNGCSIGGSCNQASFIIDMASILGPLDQTNSPDDEKKKDKDQGDESDDGSGVDPSLRLINTTPINLNHPIDEPVTSGGDVVIGGGPVQP